MYSFPVNILEINYQINTQSWTRKCGCSAKLAIIMLPHWGGSYGAKKKCTFTFSTINLLDCVFYSVFRKQFFTIRKS